MLMLTTSLILHRKPKDGTDGVGITSADVVFAQSKSSTNPPADTDVWKTNVKELSLVDGYLWSGTKIIYSNKNIAITGKYCIGSTRDFTDIEELYYLSDSGDKIPTNVTFQSSFKPEKGKYLWTCIRYRFKAQSGSAENTNWVYSTPTCAGYFGDDGVSVQSSDVVFAISESRNTAPTTGWITNFSGLTLESGKYVWTCTKTILTSSSTPIYTGAYCLGECYDFAKVDELYALGSSATKSPDIDSSLGVNIWQPSYTPKKGMYLWTCVRVTYNSNTSPYYLNKKCVSYFPKDGTNGTNGTSFNLLGTAVGHMKTWVKPSPFLWNTIYLVDGVNGGYPMTYKITTEGVKSAKADVGDAYIIDGNLWVANTTEWVNVGNIQGAPGEPGQDGEDALNIELSTDKILFSWDRKNKSYDVATKDITLVVKQGNNIINISDYTINFQAVENFDIGSNNKNIRTDGASDGYSYNISVYSAGIAMPEYTFNASVNDKKQTVNYPASSCSVKMLITYNGITYTKIIAIEVSFVQMYGDLAWNTEQLSSIYGELVSTGGRLYKMETNIAQNAKNITLTATKTDGLEKQYSEIKVQYDSINISVRNINDGLAATGINITKGTIHMTAANFILVNNDGVQTLGVDAFGNCSFTGTINATGGSFGSLQITSFTDSTGFNFYGMSAHTAPTSVIPASTYKLSNQGLYIGSGLKTNGGSVWIGSNGRKTDNDFSWDDGVIKVDADNSEATNAEISGIGVNVVGNPSHSAIGMKVSATGGNNNYAVYAENGDFIAENGAFIGVHRGNVKKIDKDYTLEKTYSTIICINKNKGITINLPKLSEVDTGTFYRIIRRGNSVTFKSYTMNIFFVSRGDLMSSVSSELASEWINCFWDGEYWYVEMSGN